GIFCASLDCELEAADFFVEVRDSGICTHADGEPGSYADGIAADIQAAIQIMDNIDQANSIDIEHGGGVGIAAHFWRIAGDTDQVLNSDRSRAKQIRLYAKNVAVTAGVMEDGLDSGLLLQEHRQCLI